MTLRYSMFFFVLVAFAVALTGCALRPQGGPDNTNWGALSGAVQKTQNR